MAVHFSSEQYEQLRQTYRKWWANELDRPIVPIVTYGHPADGEVLPGPRMSFPTAWDFSIDPRDFVNAYDTLFSTMRWHGEAFPYFPTVNFGPGVLAAFLGCIPVSAEHTVWFQPPAPDISIQELHFEFQENNRYFRRVVNLMEAAMEKWHGSVVIPMVDLGGIMDVLASFVGSENLLLELLDHPDEVLRCVSELQELWFLYYDKLNAIMASEAQGYSHWYRVFHEKPGYIFQSDFSYMISPEMFGRFIAPELSSSGQRVFNGVYHMDGIGQLPHLDQLLAMDSIKGIQWVPGSGEPENQNWDWLYERILASGKKLIQHGQKPDGRPIDLAKNPGQLYFQERGWMVGDLDPARRYADLFGIELTL